MDDTHILFAGSRNLTYLPSILNKIYLSLCEPLANKTRTKNVNTTVFPKKRSLAFAVLFVATLIAVIADAYAILKGQRYLIENCTRTRL